MLRVEVMEEVPVPHPHPGAEKIPEKSGGKSVMKRSFQTAKGLIYICYMIPHG